MKPRAWLFILCLAVASLARADIPLVLYFTDYHATDTGHEYGRTVTLWKNGKDYLGMFVQHEGLVGDNRRFALKHLVYEEQSGRLAFEYSRGGIGYKSVEDKIVQGVATYRYEGVVSRTAYIGTLSIAYDPKPMNVQLNRSEPFRIPRRNNNAYPWNKSYLSYEDWRKYFR